MPHRIILDTDIGSDVDDALALALALAAPEIELVAVTTVSGDTRLRARIAARLLDLAGRGGVPVYAGCEQPRSGPNTFGWFGIEGKGILGDVPDPPIADEHAVDALCRLLRAHGDIEVVTIGPLTNLAAALAADPELAGRIARLTLMGGYVRPLVHAGQEVLPVVDYNLCADPVASRAVLTAGIPVRMVPCEVTLATWLTESDLHALDAAPGEIPRALARAVREWTPFMRQGFGALGVPVADDAVAFLHDPLALACVYDESFCRFEDLAIEPVTQDGIFRTLERPPGTPGTVPIRCATAVQAERIREHVRQRLTAQSL